MNLVVEMLLNKFSTMFKSTQVTHSVMGVALKAAFDIIVEFVLLYMLNNINF